ncbi:hypothetical protein [Dyella choica]|uniref:Uncharacterized protein n=1 Tax=Dyella choica TaxID=1927959 RepID=A0A432M985_9GAMM|nr:hypothetical protein [Dyella choica]RUL78776.1 hypothetical protein EKH80_02900 [Dyella choica]
MPAPLRVYLDSQDFSRLSAMHAEAAEYLPVKKALLDLRHRGVAEFVFSDIHIFECLPVEQTHGQEGQARIDVLVELCGRNNLPAFGNVIEYELKKLAAAKGYYRHPVRLSKDWFPEVEIDLSAFDRDTTMKVDAAKYQGTSRAQRRVALKNARKKRRSMTMEEANHAGLQDILARFPVRKADVPRMLGIFRGTVSQRELIHVIREGLSDVASFCRWIIEHWAEGESFVRILRDVAVNFHASMVWLYDEMRGLHQQAKGIHTGEEMSVLVGAMFEETRERFLSSGPGSLAEQLLSIDVPVRGLRMSPEETPSLYSAFDYLSRVLFQSAPEKNARNPRKKKPSDFLDGMHAIFLPMVDVFRADAQSQALLSQQGEKQRDKLAPSLKDLPAFIERKAASRAGKQQMD